MHRNVARCFRGLTTSAVALLIALPLVAEPRTVDLDFAQADQLDQLREIYSTEARYPHTADIGADGEPGMIESINRGGQGEQVWLDEPRFDLRREAVSVSVDVRFEADADGGLMRTFIGLADRDDVNLQQGEGKVGVRVFKADKPKYPDRPFVLQLVNGVATRNLGEQFAVNSGTWYRLSSSFALESDQKLFAFTASLEELDASGQPAGLRREGSGTTRVLQAYRTNAMLVGLLGQNRQGGATGFDNLRVTAEPLSHAAAPDTKLDQIAFLPPPMPVGKRAPDSTLFGACGHFMHTDLFYGPDQFSQYWQLEYTLPFLVDANLGWVREPLYQPWFDDPNNAKAMQNREVVERYLQKYSDAGVKVMVVAMAVNEGNAKHVPFREGYFRWLGDLANTYPAVRIIEMHNEPNLKFFWQGTAEEYVAVYRRGAEIIREAAPEVPIAVGSMSSLWWGPGIDWFEKMAEHGGLAFADAVAVHPYHKKAPPERDPHYEGAAPDDPHNFLKAAREFRTLVQSLADGRDLPIYFTELGYSSGIEGMAAVGDPTLQADYLTRTMMLYLELRLTGYPLEGVFWYDLKNDGTNRHGESNFGLISYDTSRTKPAYDAYRRIASTFLDPSMLSPAPSVSVESSNAPQAVATKAWQRDDGALIVPFWRMEHLQESDEDFATRLVIDGVDADSIKQVVLFNLHESMPRDIGFAVEDGKLDVPVRVSRRAGWLEIHR